MRRVFYGIALAWFVAIGTAAAETPLFAYPLERPSLSCIVEAQHQCAKTNLLDFSTADAFRFFVQGKVRSGEKPINVFLRYISANGESGYLGGDPIPITIGRWTPPLGGGNPPVYASPIICLPPDLPKKDVQLFLVWGSATAPVPVSVDTLTSHFAAQPSVEFYTQ